MMDNKELINNIRMALLRMILDIPDETLEKALEKTTEDINKQIPESHCETCAYECLEETSHPCNECMYSHKNMWRHKGK